MIEVSYKIEIIDFEDFDRKLDILILSTLFGGFDYFGLFINDLIDEHLKITRGEIIDGKRS
jgi:hypothetical protein